MPTLISLLSDARNRLAREWRWYRSHGASVEAYVERYGEPMDEEHCFGDGGKAIHEADLGVLTRCCLEAMELANRLGYGHPKRTP